jgi:hypothetical protein
MGRRTEYCDKTASASLSLSLLTLGLCSRDELRVAEVLSGISSGFDIAATGSLELLCNEPPTLENA